MAPVPSTVTEEKAPARDEAWFRILLERSQDVLYTLDASFMVRFWSPGAAQALGWTPAEMDGAFGLDFIHPDDLPLMTAPAPEAREGDVLRIRFRVRHRDGGWRTLQAVVVNRLADPRVGAIVVNARDVTDQLALEARLSEASRLDSLGRLAGGVAHDFNNLLTVILASASFVADDARGGQVANEADVQAILSAAERARLLTGQLLAFARRQVIAPVVLDLNELVRAAEQLLARLIGEDVKLETHLAPDLGRVHCDPTQLQQVLINLAVNARDAMPGGGHLELSTRNVTLDAALARDGVRPGPAVALTVRDTGVGLSPEAREHLFEPFFTTKGPGHGTGLGLATVHGIVAQNGGTISVESTPGAGTVFTVVLPATDEALSFNAPRPRFEGSPGGETVLLVEDDVPLGTVTARILRDAGYRVVRAHSGEEALPLARREALVDVLITDVVMHGLDGRKVAAEVTRAHPEARVLYVSGFPQDVLGSHGVVDEGLQFLAKPFTGPELIARVQALLAAAAPRSHP